MSASLLIALLVRIFANPLANVYQKQLTQKKISPLYVNFTTYFLLSLGCLALVFFIDWSVVTRMALIYAFIAGLLGAIGNGLLIKAFEKGDLSILGPINSYKAVVSLIFGIFVLGEIPGLWGMAGIALIILGSYFVLDTTEERFSWKLFKNREIQFRIGAMVVAAIEATFIKKTILFSSVEFSFMSWCWFGAIFAFIIMKCFRVGMQSEVSKINSELGLKFILLVVCIGLMQYTTNYVFENMVVGYALSLFQLSVIISIFFGYSIFKEKNIKKKLIGSVIMIGGSVLIILLN